MVDQADPFKQAHFVDGNKDVLWGQSELIHVKRFLFDILLEFEHVTKISVDD
jgi:hypothetical protein